MSVAVRDAAASDAKAVVALLAELGYPVDEAFAHKRLGATGPGVLVAERQGQVVGVIGYHPIPLIAEDGCFVRITALSVAESERGRGAGRALVAEVERRARALGASELEVSSGRRAERDAAHAFYPALGFADSAETSVVYRKPLG